MTARQANFNAIAGVYRWLEHLTLGRALERCRLYYLPLLKNCSEALVLGDGDGRFLARLLRQNPILHATAVDTSANMLRLLLRRCDLASPTARTRLRTHCIDAITFLATPSTTPYDLVVTHFFLDCFTEAEVASLVPTVRKQLAPGALWVISDFNIPNGVMRRPAELLVRSLYLAFRILTGLRVTRLPDHTAILLEGGFTLQVRHLLLFGILATEVWRA